MHFLFLGHTQPIRFNSQTTPSYLFKAASKTTIPIVVDDVNERAADSWEELIIDAYNGTGRGTRMYNVETFITLPILSANWTISADRPRAHTRSIHIPFQPHEDEPDASTLFDEMCCSRTQASRSVGVLIQLSQCFEREETKTFIKENISSEVASILRRYNSSARFVTTHSTFMFFFLKVSTEHVHPRVAFSYINPLVCMCGNTLYYFSCTPVHIRSSWPR